MLNVSRLIKSSIAALAVVAGGATAMTAVTDAQDESIVSVSVNRINKGDRLIPMATNRMLQHFNSTQRVPSGKLVPVGCDPAFSPVTDPRRAHIFGRCMA